MRHWRNPGRLLNEMQCDVCGARARRAFPLRGEVEALREALDAEARAEQAEERAYWEPLKAELAAWRRAERPSA